jgi:tetratricopeptide (TPR) repeat protein
MNEDTELNQVLAETQKLIQSKQFAEAEAKVNLLLESHPDHGDALYMRAVCQRYTNQFDAALTTLTELQRRFPLFGRAFQEEGHLRLQRREPEQALAVFQTATRLNPALLASWQAQANLFRATGKNQEAAQTEQQLARLQQLPKPLLAAIDLASQGKLLKAEDICRKFLQKNPTHIEGMRQLADIGVKLGVLDDAEFLLESAVKLDPQSIAAQIDYVQVLRKKQRFADALSAASKLLARQPENPQLQSLYAIVCMQTGEFDEALSYLEHVLVRLPNDPSTLTSKGHALKTVGRFDEAVDAYRGALISQPNHGEAYFSLSNLKTYQFTDAEMSAMHEQEQNSLLAPKDRGYLCFALGKAYEDRKAFETAFRFYDEGNRIKKSESRYDADKISEELKLQTDVCTAELFERFSGVGNRAPDPIFILGLPRAGSTLLEQILSSHSQVDGTLELPNILSLSHRLRRGIEGIHIKGYPEILPELSAEHFKAFGEEFIRDTQIHRAGAPYFIDKMPNNFRHIGLIKLILPNAKIIDARRDPMSCCFSGFKQLFAEGQDFTYSLEDIGQYYQDYVALMDHWDEVLPGAVLRVQHEDVVADLEGQVRRILDYCELEFEQACVDYHKTERSVRTPSSEQVRQPIFTDSLEQWRNFEPFLEPLKTALATPSQVNQS